MNKNIQLPKVAKVSAWVVAGLAVSLPFIVSSAGLIPCGDKGETSCGFEDLIKLANTVVKFLLYDVSIPLAALGFAWSGGKLVMNKDKEGAWSEAKESFWNIILGFGIIIAAFVLVKAFLFAFLNTDAGFRSFLLS